MEFGSLKVNINPVQPVKQCGFIQQVQPILDVHDDLYLRLALIKNQGKHLIYASLDNIGISEAQSDTFQRIAKEKFGEDTATLVSCTHTHFGGDPKDEVYGAQLIDAFRLALETVHPHDVGEITYAYRRRPFKGIGNSRISGHDAFVLLETFSLHAENHRIATFVIHNVHPTIMNGFTPFFSAEYPGMFLKLCSVSCPGEFFTFMQGADGDVSTRFVRKEQSHDEVRRLASILHDEVETMLKEEVEHSPFDFMFDETEIPLEHEFIDPETRSQGEALTPRELETIEYGRKVLERLRANENLLPKTMKIQRLRFPGYTQVFAQNELFSEYIEALPEGKASLICYTQGYRPYVTGLRPVRLTYELFSDTLSAKSKRLLFDTLYQLTH